MAPPSPLSVADDAFQAWELGLSIGMDWAQGLRPYEHDRDSGCFATALEEWCSRRKSQPRSRILWQELHPQSPQVLNTRLTVLRARQGRQIFGKSRCLACDSAIQTRSRGTAECRGLSGLLRDQGDPQEN